MRSVAASYYWLVAASYYWQVAASYYWLVVFVNLMLVYFSYTKQGLASLQYFAPFLCAVNAVIGNHQTNFILINDLNL